MKATVLASIRSHLQHVALHRARKRALVRLGAKMKPELGSQPQVCCWSYDQLLLSQQYETQFLPAMCL